jgi:hypothetical protein
MTRLFQTGFEIQTHITGGGGPDGNTSNFSTSTKRSGAASLRLAASSNSSAGIPSNTSTGKVYLRTYFYKTGNHSSAHNIWAFSFTANGTVAINSSGQIYLLSQAGVQIGSASSALSDNTWYRIEVELDFTTGGQTTVTLKLDGTTLGSGITAASLSGMTTANFYGPPVGASVTYYYDDFAMNDNSGSVNNSWCGAGAVLLMLPDADVQDGSWTVASGGNTNQYDSINNTPPTGSAASDAARIENIDGSPDNSTDELRVSTPSYTSLGLASGATVNAIIPWVCAGEEVSTGTKSISFGLLSNPAGSLNAVADVTNGVTGAVGTYPATWYWQKGAAIEAPSVTLGTAPQLNLRKTDTGTRSATVCFLGAYVDYTPASGNTGTLNVTLDAATGDLDIAGTLNSTLGTATLEGIGTIEAGDITGELNVTLDAATLSGTGDLDIAGTLAATLDAATLASNVDVIVSGTLSASLDAATVAATGDLDIAGTLNSTLDAATVAATGDLDIVGSLSVTLDAATLAGTGDLDIVGTLSVTLDAATLEGIGSTQNVQNLTPALFTSATGAFYSPTVSATYSLTPSLFTNTATFYSPTVSATYAVTPSLFTSATGAFYSPTVSATYSVTPSLFTSATGAFYSPTVTPGAVTLTPSLYTNTATFYSPAITASYSLTPSLFTSATGVFYGPTVTTSYGLTPSLFTNTASFYSPTVTTSYSVTPSLYTNTAVFYSPTVVAGQILTPSLFTNTGAFYSPTVTPGSVTLSPSLFTSGTGVFYSPTVSSGSTTLSPSLFTNTGAFYGPTVTSNNSLTPALFTDGDTFYSPTVSYDQTLTPSLFTSATGAFYTPVVTSVYNLGAPYISPGSVLYTPTVTLPDYELTPSLFTDSDVFYSPTVANDTHSVYAPFFDQTRQVYDSSLKYDVVSGKMVKLLTNKVALTF